MSHSEIIKDFDVFSDYASESEFSYNWHFEFKGGKLKFTGGMPFGFPLPMMAAATIIVWI